MHSDIVAAMEKTYINKQTRRTMHRLVEQKKNETNRRGNKEKKMPLMKMKPEQQQENRWKKRIRCMRMCSHQKIFTIRQMCVTNYTNDEEDISQGIATSIIMKTNMKTTNKKLN